MRKNGNEIPALFSEVNILINSCSTLCQNISSKTLLSAKTKHGRRGLDPSVLLTKHDEFEKLLFIPDIIGLTPWFR